MLKFSIALALAFACIEAGLPTLPGFQPGGKSVRTSSTDEDQVDYLAQQRLLVQLLKQRPELLSSPQQQQGILESENIQLPWNCPPFPPSTSVPTSVHQLRPGDIKVIGALGDSITAGNGVRASSVLETLFAPNRGESWSIGGEKSLDEGVLTLPNILRKFNPNITGSSTCRHTRQNEQNQLNVAVPGATNRGIPEQAYNIMAKMLEDESIDYWNDWKVITIFIGGNDLCRVCQNWDEFNSDKYYSRIEEALNLFYDHLPRAIINLQPMFDLSVLKDMMIPGEELLCKATHQSFCPCVLVQGIQRQVQLEYFDKMAELTDGRYDTRPDFTVVLQPHLRDLIPWKFPNGTYDMSFVAPDCFHPSHKGHQAFAFMMWNMMLTPVGMKTTNYTMTDDEELVYKCPTEANPYIYTNCNSNRPDLCGLGRERNSQRRKADVDA